MFAGMTKMQVTNQQIHQGWRKGFALLVQLLVCNIDMNAQDGGEAFPKN